MKGFLISVMMILLLAVSASASLYWVTEANAGYDWTGCNYCGYSLNYPSPLENVTNTSYSSCTLSGGSSFTPVAFDVDGDTYDEIITGTTSTLYVYGRDCALIDTITLAKTMTGSPVVTNSDGDSQLDLVVGSNKGVSVYEWSSVQNEFILQHYIGDTASSYASLSCPFLSSRCLGFQSGSGSNGVAVFDMVNQSYYTGTAGLTKTANDKLRPSISSLRISLPLSYQYKIPYCSLTSTGYDVTCGIWNENGNLSGSYTIMPLPNVQAVDTIDSFFAKIGGATYLFTYYRTTYTGGSPNLYYEGLTISDSVTYSGLYNASTTHILNATYGKFYSNWAIGDFDKDGENEACYLYGSEFEIAGSYANRYNKTFLKCLDSTLSAIIDEDVTGIIDINNIVMGDFMPSSNYLGIASYGGIFYYDGGNLNMLLNSSKTGKSFGFPIIYFDGASGSPIVVFTDDTSGFIMKASAIGESCGNGVCDVYENSFNCFEDCNLNETLPPSDTYENGTAPVGIYSGFDSTICASGYQEYGKCALRPAGKDCTLHSQCLSGTCANNKCTDAGIWKVVDGSVKGTFGADETSLIFISIFMLLLIAVALIVITRGSMAGIIIAGLIISIGLVFFTLVGWLPVFFLFMLVLLVIVVIVTLLVLSKGGG